MIFGDCAHIRQCVIHKVGNKLEDDIILSKDMLTLTEEMETMLLRYIFNGFKAKEYYNLSSDDDLSENAVYTRRKNCAMIMARLVNVALCDVTAT